MFFDYKSDKSKNGRKYREKVKKEEIHAKPTSLGKHSSGLLMSIISGKAEFKFL